MGFISPLFSLSNISLAGSANHFSIALAATGQSNCRHITSGILRILNSPGRAWEARGAAGVKPGQLGLLDGGIPRWAWVGTCFSKFELLINLLN